MLDQCSLRHRFLAAAIGDDPRPGLGVSLPSPLQGREVKGCLGRFTAPKGLEN